MKMEDLEELHYITPISNVPSIMSRGILCHKFAQKVAHESVAMQEIQDRRARKTVPGGLPVHHYVNLYMNARNKMLFKVVRGGLAHHSDLCILRVSTKVLDLPGVVVASQNVGSDYVRFDPPRAGLEQIDRALLFARYWTHDNLIDTYRHGSIVCAEVLVPDRVDPCYIIGAYVSCEDAKAALEVAGVAIDVAIKPNLFFR